MWLFEIGCLLRVWLSRNGIILPVVVLQLSLLPFLICWYVFPPTGGTGIMIGMTVTVIATVRETDVIKIEAVIRTAVVIGLTPLSKLYSN